MAKIFIDDPSEKNRLSEDIVSLSDKTNKLLDRREMTVLFREQAGKLTRKDASQIVANKFGLNKNCVIPMYMKSERGKKDLVSMFYSYETEEAAKRQLPRYRLLRNLSKEDRKKIVDEEKAAKLKAKQAAGS